MNILITGGAGFIGSNLALYLQQKGHKVLCIDNLRYGYKENLTHISKRSTPIKLIKKDIRDPTIAALFSGVDVVFHFAAISSLPECQHNPCEAYEVNTAGTALVLELARRHHVRRFIFSSTSGVYENEKIFPTPEEANSIPTLTYSLSKKLAEEICDSFRQLYDMDIVILRFFNVYGPHMDTKRVNPPVISYIVECLLQRKAPILHSDGKQSRDMIYVEDVIRLCEEIINSPHAKNQLLNVGSGKTYSLRKIYKQITDILHVTGIRPVYRTSNKLWEGYPDLFSGPYPFKTVYLEKEVNKQTLASIEKARMVLHWTPKITITEGLQKTVRFALNKKNQIGTPISIVSKKK